jgi:hypothetical protein
MSPVVNRVHAQIQVDTTVDHAFEFACLADRQREWNPYLALFHATRLDTVGAEFDAIVADVVPRQAIHLHLAAEHGAADWWYRFAPSEGGVLFAIDVEYEKDGLLAGVVDRLVFHGGLERAVRHIAENFAAVAPTRVLVPA